MIEAIQRYIYAIIDRASRRILAGEAEADGTRVGVTLPRLDAGTGSELWRRTIESFFLLSVDAPPAAMCEKQDSGQVQAVKCQNSRLDPVSTPRVIRIASCAVAKSVVAAMKVRILEEILQETKHIFGMSLLHKGGLADLMCHSVT